MNAFAIRTVKVCAILFALTYTGNSVWAASQGYVTGRLMFYNNQGNYCKPVWFRDSGCEDARYPEWQHGVNLPIRDTKIYLWSTGILIGMGVTDASGRFLIRWYHPDVTEASVLGSMKWRMEHKDDRFSIRKSDGSRWEWVIHTGQLNSGTTTDLGTYVRGNNNFPNPFSNLYDGALRMWDSLSHSNLMRDSFTNVEIRMYDNSCPGSCASPEGKLIAIPTRTAAFMPQHNVMHEMGHIASYLSHSDQKRRMLVDYSRDGDTVHRLNSPEYASASFEEGLATFFADRALYFQKNHMPLSCHSTGPCPRIHWYDVEESTGKRSTCAFEEERWELTVTRYLRDVYDAGGNSEEPFDTNAVPFYQFFEALHHFPAGYSNGDKDEPWLFTNHFYGIPMYFVDDRDGRSALDFRAHIEAVTGQETRGNYLNNCYPAGD